MVAVTNLILYGPPGCGKTTVGRLVATRLGREFVEGDEWIHNQWGRPVTTYFESGEEALFRAREAEACRLWSSFDGKVIAPGGGALLDPHSRAALEGTGVVLCLTASLETLLDRLGESQIRPLLLGNTRASLTALLRERKRLYSSFALLVSTVGRTVESVADEVIARFQASEGITRFELGECSVLMGRGLLSQLPEFLEARKLRPPFVGITDSNVASLYGDTVHQILSAPPVQFAGGEMYKTLDTVHELYSACLARGLERGGTVLALGGGVVGDVAGFVAATFMRGVRWVNLPTSVLAMADSSLGGKVGVDLPQGKNLVGAFHPPSLVVADFDTLATLPEVEIRNGLAEVVKAGVIGDPDLFSCLPSLAAESADPGMPLRSATGTIVPLHFVTGTVASVRGWCAVQQAISLEKAIARAAAVKVGIVNADPRENGERAKLNAGHTIGHGIEVASGYTIRHGEAVAIGLCSEAHIAESLGLAERGLAERFAVLLMQLGLPTDCVGLDAAAIRASMRSDKKKSDGKLRFALPRQVGEVVCGIKVDETLITETLEIITGVR